MNATIALARAELTMLARNRTAAVNAVLIPLGMGIGWVLSDPPAGFAAWGAILQVLLLAGMTIITTSTATLVARRQQQVLQRWRSSGASISAILAGTLSPMYLLLVAQATLLFSATAFATGSSPSQPILLGLGVLLGGALAVALACATASLTRSVDASTMTSFPAAAALMGGGLWVMTVATGESSWWMLATGGGAVAELIRIGWDGPPGGGGLGDHFVAVWPSLVAVIVLTLAATMVASRIFRWGPRE